MKFDLRSIVPLGVIALTLAACQGEKKPATKGAAGGEVLPGSASDAMLPVDTVRSQPPLAPKPTASAGSGVAKPRAGSSDASEATSAEEAPAAEPAAEPAAAQ